MTLQVNDKWFKLQAFSKSNISNVININSREFIVMSSGEMFKYDSKTNGFEHTIKCSEIGYGDQIAFNENKHELYFYTYIKQLQLYSFNLQSKQYNEIVGDIPSGEYLLFIDGYFYIINNHNAYFIGSIENKTMQPCFNTLMNENANALNCGKAIYIPSKQSILLIGGFGERDIDSKDLWIYSLITQKWKKMDDISFEGYSFSAVLTSNQRYIVIFGGYCGTVEQNDHISDNIYVLDMKNNNWKINKCKIRCPIAGICAAARTGGIDSKNDILVIAYIKQCFKMKEFQHLALPPIYIIMIIVKWYDAEIIHWLRSYHHFGIYLKDILSCLAG